MIYVDVDINQCVCVYVFEGFELVREIKLELDLIGRVCFSFTFESGFHWRRK